MLVWSVQLSVRCSRPKMTTRSTASQTLSHDVRNASAVSFHESRRPTGQKQHVDVGQLMLAVAPRNFFHEDSLAPAASYAAHRVQQENQEPPQRDEVVTPLGESIVTGRRLMAAGTNRHRALRGRTAISMLLWSEANRAYWQTKPRK